MSRCTTSGLSTESRLGFWARAFISFVASFLVGLPAAIGATIVVFLATIVWLFVFLVAVGYEDS